MEDLLLTKETADLAYYTIGKYDDLCEEHFRIEKIIPLRKTTLKKVINVIINIISVGLIQFVYGLFPKVEKTSSSSEINGITYSFAVFDIPVLSDIAFSDILFPLLF